MRRIVKPKSKIVWGIPMLATEKCSCAMWTVDIACTRSHKGVLSMEVRVPRTSTHWMGPNTTPSNVTPGIPSMCVEAAERRKNCPIA